MELRTVGKELTKTDYKTIMIALNQYKRNNLIGTQYRMEAERVIKKIENVRS